MSTIQIILLLIATHAAAFGLGYLVRRNNNKDPKIKIDV